MADATYPKRPSHFAHRFTRLMAKACLANEIGPDGCWLLTVVAMTEDAKGYRGAVTFFNSQLLPLAGCRSEDTLARVRGRAVAAGWLHYEPGGKGKAGRYWVLVPDRLTGVDDAPSDERAEEYVAPVSPRTGAGTTAGEVRGQPREKCGDNRGRSAGTTAGEVRTIPPAPVPKADRQADGRPAEVDPLREAEAAHKEFAAAWNAAGLKRLERLNPTLQGRLAANLLDGWWAANWRAALARAGANPWLAAGAGRRKGPLDVAEFLADGDFVRKVLDGVYDPRPDPKATGPPPDPARVRRAADNPLVNAPSAAPMEFRARA